MPDEMIKQLLTKWADLEPGQCQLSGFEIFTIAGRGICADFTYSHAGTYIYERELVLAWVEYAVHQAMDSQKLNYNIRRRHPGIFHGGRADGFAVDVFLGDGWLMNDIYYPSLAEALLTMYLGAILTRRSR